MIRVTVTGDGYAADSFRRAGGSVRLRVRNEVEAQAQKLKQFIIDEQLSGQMLKVRRGRLRTQMRYLMKEDYGFIKADIHPKPGSPLWMLGTGEKEQGLDVKSYSRRYRPNDVFQGPRVFRKGRMKRRKLLAAGMQTVKAHPRNHHLHKVPFMEMALATHRDRIRGGIEKAVSLGLREVGGESFDTGGGI